MDNRRVVLIMDRDLSRVTDLQSSSLEDQHFKCSRADFKGYGPNARSRNCGFVLGGLGVRLCRGKFNVEILTILGNPCKGHNTKRGANSPRKG